MIGWTGHQYGATYENLAVLLGRYDGKAPVSDSAVRHWVRRMEAAKLMRCVRPVNEMWVTPTPKGYALVELSYRSWNAPVNRLAHSKNVNAVRLWFEASPRRVAEMGTWTSERELFCRRGSADYHVADGLLSGGTDGEVTAVEWESVIKFPVVRYERVVLGRLDPAITALLYVCPKPLATRLDAILAGAAGAAGRSHLDISVMALSELR